MNKALESLIDEITNTKEVIEFKRLEKLVLENKDIKEKLGRLHEVEKQAVNARELGLENTYLMYKKEYDDILASFEGDVLISSYLTAKEEVLSIVKLIIDIVENEINKVIND